MWAVVVVFIGMISGPRAIAVTDAGTFKSEAECQAAIRAAIPSKLDGAARAEFTRGERRYVCVHVTQDAKPSSSKKN